MTDNRTARDEYLEMQIDELREEIERLKKTMQEQEKRIKAVEERPARIVQFQAHNNP